MSPSPRSAPEPADPTSRPHSHERRTPQPPRVRASLVRRCAWRLSDWTYRNGWAASLARRVGLQGSVHTRAHTLAVRQRRGPALRLVFASDFHAGPLTHPAALDAACRAIAAARPDVLLLGGDFVQRRARDVDVLAERLSCITPPLGKFAVLGNHDYLGDYMYIVERLEDAGVVLLTNDNARLPAPHDDVWVCGLDDPLWGHPDREAALDGAEGTRLVLMHAPDGLLALRDARFDVAFCGHTHGGQVALPLGVPLVLPTGLLCRRYAHGLFELDEPRGARLLVSKGIGFSGVPVRLFAAPEIHACEVVARTESGAASEAA